MRAITLALLIGLLACGSPAPAKKTISTEDTMAAFGHTTVDTTGLAAAKARAAISQRTLDSQNAAIRERNRGTKLAPSSRIVRKSP